MDAFTCIGRVHTHTRTSRAPSRKLRRNCTQIKLPSGLVPEWDGLMRRVMCHHHHDGRRLTCKNNESFPPTPTPLIHTTQTRALGQQTGTVVADGGRVKCVMYNYRDNLSGDFRCDDGDDDDKGV